MNIETVLRWTTAALLSGAAAGELTRQPVVMEGLAQMGYPAFLVWILAPAKLAAVAALLFAPHTDLARAAWLGLWLNLCGAVASMALAGVALWPDVVVAPVYLALITAGALAHERAAARRRGRDPSAGSLRARA